MLFKLRMDCICNVLKVIKCSNVIFIVDYDSKKLLQKKKTNILKCQKKLSKIPKT